MQPAQAEGGGSSSITQEMGSDRCHRARHRRDRRHRPGVRRDDDDGDAAATPPRRSRKHPRPPMRRSRPTPRTTPRPRPPSPLVAVAAARSPSRCRSARPRSRASRSRGANDCDPETGHLAVRDFFAPECYAPFEGDNGGETASGVTADSIKVVYYLGPDDDPIINYITAAIANDDTNADSGTDARRHARDLRAVLRAVRPHRRRRVLRRALGAPTTRWPPAPTPSASPRRSSRSPCSAGRH